MLLGLAFGAGTIATGCDKPESGSLENVKNRKDQIQQIDYAKLDYSKIDYGKIDYGKIDYGKIDNSRIKLDEASLAKLAETNVKRVTDKTLVDEVLRRLNEQRVLAEQAKNEKLLADIDTIIKAAELNKGMIGDIMCW